ncbi:cardiolipin synthase [Marinobacterium nitratireducens]|uniref:Cardiolipin synthase n=1 Tax=Marinobacterium nitratireducens TaxID=518897 RepID=A0A917ZJF3_9GAMM|nr:cardiolipin synthase [Marinobacterium nitratireducens]GGO84746.1 cardiolipin synthase [Marinobacterium nitratireducens]
MIAALVTLFYLAGLFSAIDSIMTTRTAQGAIAWSISLVSIPFVAVPAYWVLGRSKFSGMVEAYEQNKDEIDGLLAEFAKGLEPWKIEVQSRKGMHRAIRQLSRTELTGGNSAQLLIDGDATFDSIVAGIADARDYILIQFYMIHDDGLGRRIQQALIERASAGVRVHLLYDEVGSKGLPERYLEALRSAGVEVSSFKPTQGQKNRFQLNFRNHRKMVVVDGRSAWVGGHNIGDEYLGRDPEFSPWRDTHVKLRGPVVQQLQAVLLADWYWATRRIPRLNWEPAAAPDDNLQAMIIASSPSQRLETAGLMFVAALQSAQERIWLSAPYFVPDEAILKALELAALRGVDVRIITTGKADSLPVFLAAFHYMDHLKGLGIRFYAYTPGFLHEKVMLIDDEISTIGTANFDNRSFRLNFEVTALIRDPAFAAQMARMFEADFAHSELIDPEAVTQKPFWWRLAVNLSRLAAPVL